MKRENSPRGFHSHFIKVFSNSLKGTFQIRSYESNSRNNGKEVFFQKIFLNDKIGRWPVCVKNESFFLEVEVLLLPELEFFLYLYYYSNTGSH